LNVLETFRGTNGYTAVPINDATISGPAGFAGAAGSADPGAGMTAVPIGAAADVFFIGSAGQITNLASADGFGIGPPASSTTGLNGYPLQPQFADVAAKILYPAGPQAIYGGPPAYPPASFVSNANQFAAPVPTGWPEGFYMLALPAPPPSGTYALAVSYTQNGNAGNSQASATLANSTLLPILPPPSIVSSGTGGATVTNNLPPGTPISEVLVNVTDNPANPRQCFPAIYTTVRFTTAGSAVIPNDLGPGGGPTYCAGDMLIAQAYGFDYLDLELGPPANTTQSPALPARADVTVSAPQITNE
jgi:hypothetical protein